MEHSVPSWSLGCRLPLSQRICMWPTLSLQLEPHPPRDPGPTLNRCPVPGFCHPGHGFLGWPGCLPAPCAEAPVPNQFMSGNPTPSPRSDASQARPGLRRTRSPDRLGARLWQLHPHATAGTTVRPQQTQGLLGTLGSPAVCELPSPTSGTGHSPKPPCALPSGAGRNGAEVGDGGLGP